MTELDALLAAVKAEPGDDTVRLVLADWLDEHGQPERGEFVRVQIELANGHPSHHTAETGCPLRFRERELFKAHRDSWLPPGVPFEGRVAKFSERERYSLYVSFPIGPKPEFRRGFFSRVSGTWEDLSQHLDSILADPWVPGLDEVELTTWPDEEAVVERLYRNTGCVYLPVMDPEAMLVQLSKLWPQVRSWKLPPEPREEYGINVRGYYQTGNRFVSPPIQLEPEDS